MPWRATAADTETRWRRLEADADGSLFLSWDFIGSFIESFGPRANFHLFEWIEDGQTLALALLDFGVIRRRGVFRVRTARLNTAVDPAADMCLEYNSVLARRGRECEAQAKLIEALLAPGAPRWDELQLRNLAPPDFETSWLRRIEDDPFKGWVAKLSPDLDRDALLQRLSSNRRSQIRRSFKVCEAGGPLQVHEAGDIETALRYFAQLGQLHNARWRREAVAGAFESANWLRFHEGVIHRAFPRGGIQLLRIAAGDTDVGYLYNFRWRGSVAMVQSGFVEPVDNAHRPGYVCHLLAMAHNAEQGASEYDLLGGEADYKRVLGTRATTQTNIRLQRKDVLSLRFEEALVQWVRRCR